MVKSRCQPFNFPTIRGALKELKGFIELKGLKVEKFKG